MKKKEEKQVDKQAEQKENVRLKDIPKDAAILGPEYDWWFNEEDDIYDKLYGDKI
ncbi:hypothetical protein [Cohnella thermotolerans]|uniref:hypothetical protein n=1 Tax=Cohnella thermotolerans TaxID=329858 RepID=UPI000412C469|nr:hypothetical protein [Cohnella thermotolerans]